MGLCVSPCVYVFQKQVYVACVGVYTSVQYVAQTVLNSAGYISTFFIYMKTVNHSLMAKLKHSTLKVGKATFN